MSGSFTTSVILIEIGKSRKGRERCASGGGGPRAEPPQLAKGILDVNGYWPFGINTFPFPSPLRLTCLLEYVTRGIPSGSCVIIQYCSQTPSISCWCMSQQSTGGNCVCSSTVPISPNFVSCVRPYTRLGFGVVLVLYTSAVCCLAHFSRGPEPGGLTAIECVRRNHRTFSCMMMTSTACRGPTAHTVSTEYVLSERKFPQVFPREHVTVPSALMTSYRQTPSYPHSFRSESLPRSLVKYQYSRGGPHL